MTWYCPNCEASARSTGDGKVPMHVCRFGLKTPLLPDGLKLISTLPTAVAGAETMEDASGTTP